MFEIDAQKNIEPLFASSHVASGTTVSTNFIFVPPGEKYTFKKIYLQGESAGTMLSFECPADGLMLAHQKPSASGQAFEHTFDINAVVDGGVSGVQCVHDREGAGSSEHTYIQVQYYPFESGTTSSQAVAVVYKADPLSFMVMVLLGLGIFFGLGVLAFKLITHRRNYLKQSV